jgi:dual specificity tyrosine-phosphorylation-regulated kinase 1
MHSGQPLFNGHNEPEQICKIVEVLGMLPKHMIENAGKSCKVKSLFVKNEKTGEYDLQYRGRTIIPSSRPLDSVIGVTTGGPGGRRVNDASHTESHYLIFADLLRLTLRLDPADRCKPAVALQHRWDKISTQTSKTKNPQISSSFSSIRPLSSPTKQILRHAAKQQPHG